ncbi:hypothetical protein [Polyangium mundeleinium]|uniref:Uncharacterized protein n=1 Tax=Polyangium mundeleinium TaxID=2995306 RepID=A0ABT5EPR7_9BACT|nr:hypothetical protein [Polyangium mundeleinium]MDC0743818.1 hypothetical protein [Polyangium mundeleinium]
MSFVARWVGVVALVGASSAGVARADEGPVPDEGPAAAPAAAPVSVSVPGAGSVTTGPAEIQLKNGSTMRGTLVNVEPGQRVIVIVAGEQSVIPWSEIAKIAGGPQEAPAPAPPAAAAPAAAAPLAPGQGVPFLHIESDWPNVELARIDGEVGGGYQQQAYAGPNTITKFMCSAPCDRLVDGRDGHRFFISAPGMFPTEAFRLDSQAGHVTARVKGTSMARFASGILLVTMGGVLSLGGVMFTAASFTMDTTPRPDNTDPMKSVRAVRTIGLITLGLGAASVVGGAMFLSEGRTRIELVKAQGANTGVVLENGVLRF